MNITIIFVIDETIRKTTTDKTMILPSNAATIAPNTITHPFAKNMAVFAIKSIQQFPTFLNYIAIPFRMMYVENFNSFVIGLSVFLQHIVMRATVSVNLFLIYPKILISVII